MALLRTVRGNCSRRGRWRKVVLDGLIETASLGQRAPAKRSLGQAWKLAYFFLGFTLMGPGSSHAQESTLKEYQVKAVFVFNFIQFTAWPDRAFPDDRAPIRVGILGENPFAGFLEAVVQGEKIGLRSVVIERGTRLQDLLGCHVVFVGRSESSRVAAIIASLAGKPVLTVGDMPDFARRGGIINFHLEDQKIRFEVNRAAAEENGLKLSSQLLRLAKIVGASVTGRGR